MIFRIRNLNKVLFKTLVLFLSFFSFIPVFNNFASAESNFLYEIKATYDIKEDRSALVTYSFITINKVDNDYLQTFSFNLPFLPKNISIAESKTPIQIKDLKQISGSNITKLDINILNPVYGKNNRFEWGFSFNVDNIVLFHGMQNAIMLPSFDDSTDISKFDINLHIPKLFGNVRYTYGNGTVTTDDKFSNIVFKNSLSKVNNFLVLMGPDQEYFFETTNITDKIDINLPEGNKYQSVIYTEFSKKTFIREEKQEAKKVSLNPGDKIKAFVKTHIDNDKNYEKSFSSVSNANLVNNISKQVKTEGKSKYDISREVFNFIVKNYSLSDFLTNVDTTINLTEKETRYNPAEINEIYRQTLTKLGIENRGAFGYVFPIQPIVRNEETTEQHVWSEFWDGTKWVVVDPVWYMTSKGGDYFDKNAFHHVKFGNYKTLSELTNFFGSYRAIKVTPLKNESDLDKKIDLQMLAYDNTYLNKEFKIILVNKSTEIIKINKLTPSVNISGIKLGGFDTGANSVIYPGSELEFNVPLEYKILFNEKEGSVRMKVEYSDSTNNSYSREFDHSVNIRSNISSYLSLFIIGFILLFLAISVISFLLYKRIISIRVRR